MNEPTAKPPIKPVKSYIRGLAIPGIIIAGCASIGALISISNGGVRLDEISGAVKLGAGFGFFISMFGVLEILAGLLIADRRFMNGVYMALGYLTVWFMTAYALGFFNGPEVPLTELLGKISSE